MPKRAAPSTPPPLRPGEVNEAPHLNTRGLEKARREGRPESEVRPPPTRRRRREPSPPQLSHRSNTPVMDTESDRDNGVHSLRSRASSPDGQSHDTRSIAQMIWSDEQVDDVSGGDGGAVHSDGHATMGSPHLVAHHLSFLDSSDDEHEEARDGGEEEEGQTTDQSLLSVVMEEGVPRRRTEEERRAIQERRLARLNQIAQEAARHERPLATPDPERLAARRDRDIRLREEMAALRDERMERREEEGEERGEEEEEREEEEDEREEEEEREEGEEGGEETEDELPPLDDTMQIVPTTEEEGEDGMNALDNSMRALTVEELDQEVVRVDPRGGHANERDKISAATVNGLTRLLRVPMQRAPACRDEFRRLLRTAHTEFTGKAQPKQLFHGDYVQGIFLVVNNIPDVVAEQLKKHPPYDSVANGVKIEVSKENGKTVVIEMTSRAAAVRLNMNKYSICGMNVTFDFPKKPADIIQADITADCRLITMSSVFRAFFLYLLPLLSVDVDWREGDREGLLSSDSIEYTRKLALFLNSALIGGGCLSITKIE